MNAVSTLVVIPAFQEEQTVGVVVDRVRACGFPVLVVDDGSTDETYARAIGAGALAVRLPINVGVGGAMRTGFRYAVAGGYDRVVQVDADLQHPPEAIPDLLRSADEGHDLVIGSRFADGYETAGSRRMAMRALAAVVSRRVRVRLDDVTSGFRVISEPLLGHFADHYPSEYLGDTVEAILQAHAFGSSIAQVPVAMDQRQAGDATSAWSASGHLVRLGVAMVAGKPERMGQ